MLDTSVIERKIHRKVMDMCLEAIVSEAFIAGLPIHQCDIDDNMAAGFARYASECMQDLGGSSLLKQAMESQNDPVKKAYLSRMYDICNETATSVTARVLEEHKGDDESLKEAAERVAMTPSEYSKFSAAAAHLTPDSLSKMIQKKTLDTIKEEKEAYKKDAELETEIVNALNSTRDDTDEVPEEDSDVPSAITEGNDAPTGADIGQSTGNPASESNLGLESFYDAITSTAKKLGYDVVTGENQAKAIMAAGEYKGDLVHTKGVPLIKADNGTYFIGRDKEGKTHLVQIEFPDGEKPASENYAHIPANDTLAKMRAIGGVLESHFVDVQNASKNDPAQNITGKQIGMACPCPVHQQKESATDPVKMAAGKIAGSQVGQQGAFAEAAKVPPNAQKASESFKSYMKTIAGDNYRASHSSIFSRLQELSYESLLSTTESYSEIPFRTMTEVTKRHTFSAFRSFDGNDFVNAMESIGLYAFENVVANFQGKSTEAEGVDAPLKEGKALNDSLLVSSIIYTFFETLNSMNLYCPKLAEIQRFVDETIPIERRVELDKKDFVEFFQKMMDKTSETLRRTKTIDEVDAIQNNLDVVREKISAPGFTDMRKDLIPSVESLQKEIDQKRDKIVGMKKKPIAVESQLDAMRRTNDVLEFNKTAFLMGKKPNVSTIRYKVDTINGSNRVAVEAYAPNGNIVGRSMIVLESQSGNLIDYVASAVKASTLMSCGKTIDIYDMETRKHINPKTF